MQEKLTFEERSTLLRLAREAITCRVIGEPVPALPSSGLTPPLIEHGASFVTLTVGGLLRGCIGALDAYQPLVEDVREHAVSAAIEDPRFPPVREPELSRIKIEVSRLTRPIPLDYENAEDLLAKLTPHVDGVVLRDGESRRATFLPQVWGKIPEPGEFMDNLCYKMGAEYNLWRKRHFEVLTYQAEDFHESSDLAKNL